jgi:transposase
VIDALTGQGINVRHACRTLEVSESGYYAWKDRPTSPRALRRIWLAGEIVTVHKASGGTYGAHRVTAELKHGRGISVGHNAVELIMRELGIKGLPTRRLPKGAKVGTVTPLDLVRREFRRSGPNRLWMTDITEHPTREGKVYCCVVLDAFSRMVVGWSIDSTQTTTLVLNVLGMATRRRNAEDELIIHSDRGVQPGLNRCSQQCVGESRVRKLKLLGEGRGCRRGGASGASAGAAAAACAPFGAPRVGGHAAAVRYSSRISAGVRQPSVLRGRLLSVAATAARSSAL